YRSVLFVKPAHYWIVSDFIKAPGGIHKYNQCWHMMPYSNVTLGASTKIGSSHFKTSANIQVIPADPTELTDTLQPGFNANPLADTLYVSYVKRQAGDARFDTILFPSPPSANPAVTVQRLQTNASIGEASVLEIHLPSAIGIYALTRGQTHSRRALGPIDTDSAVAYVQTDRVGRYELALIADGSVLSHHGADLIKSDLPLAGVAVRWSGDAMEISTAQSAVGSKSPCAIFADAGVTIARLNGRQIPLRRSGNAITVILD